MGVNKLITIYCCFILLLTGCGKQLLESGDYVRWLTDESNGLRQQREIANTIYDLQFKPNDLLYLQSGNQNSGTVDSSTSPYGNLLQFSLKITPKDGKELSVTGGVDEATYLNRLNYIETQMQYDFSLAINNDTFPCVFFHGERNYGVSEGSVFQIAFETTQIEQGDIKVIYHDRILDSGPVVFEIDEADMNNIPVLKR
jgi:hypothetical protein